jgi:hypothetical protein
MKRAFIPILITFILCGFLYYMNQVSISNYIKRNEKIGSCLIKSIYYQSEYEFNIGISISHIIDAKVVITENDDKKYENMNAIYVHSFMYPEIKNMWIENHTIGSTYKCKVIGKDCGSPSEICYIFVDFLN